MPNEIRDTVQRSYAETAKKLAARRTTMSTSCCSTGPHEDSLCTAHAVQTDCGSAVFGPSLYNSHAFTDGPTTALEASLGCGVPTAVADLHPGEIVLDLGSGAGADVLLAARRVLPGGRVIGLDMTPEMLTLARNNALEAHADNVEFIEGYLEDIPLATGSVDVVISNCVINLAADKQTVLDEAARVLRPGGRLAISDVIADPSKTAAARIDFAQWTGCIAGALTRDQYEDALAIAGFIDVDISETHRVSPSATAAVVRARRADHR